ncbi:FHA domain-containing protein [Microbacterium sp. zg.Y909]|uniref:FHA domain-containing protein n=1 Tax=Microbacterium sp. zg.Y909 TaxID=2969413 RepID=UPI00214ACD4C|nr:FHA domain-containing protein [Microbacterium sp. zg.Y909]MCR2827775.1 FHA domain-containing protein [Microbacterium sp. zg.Y909]
MFSYSVAPVAAEAGFAMVGDRFLLVASSEIGDASARELWTLLSAGDTALEDVLSALAERGIELLPDFALVELVDARTSSVNVAVRGTAEAQLHGPERTTLAGPGIGTWVEGSAQHVAGIALTLGATSPTALLPLGRGVVRSDRLQWGTVPPERPAPADRAGVVPDWAADLEDDAAQSTTVFDREELAALVSAAVGARPDRARAAARPDAPRRLVLAMDGGRVLELDLPVVFGRAPDPGAHPGARLVPLSSPRREISGTHIEVVLDGDHLLVRDLDSTNGTVVRHADGSAMLLRGGATARLAEGAVLDIGDGNVARFHAAP